MTRPARARAGVRRPYSVTVPCAGMPPRARAPDWKDWLERWDRQQEAFNPTREARFDAMMDVLEVRLGRRFRVLDLGCGPGSFSQRILRRFPAARVVAVDYDPVVRQIGQGALGTMGGRLTWVDAKLGAPGWRRALPPGRFDGAVSTTALHWLTARPAGRGLPGRRPPALGRARPRPLRARAGRRPPLPSSAARARPGHVGRMAGVVDRGTTGTRAPVRLRRARPARGEPSEARGRHSALGARPSAALRGLPHRGRRLAGLREPRAARRPLGAEL